MTYYVRKCPACAGYAIRVNRRFVDRVISLIAPVQRYQCQNFQCQWQGNIKKNLFLQYDNDML